MRQVIVYVTSDEKQFQDKEKATEHQIVLDTFNDLKKLLEASFNTGRADAVLKEMIVEAQNVKDILTRFQKRQPRKSRLAA